ncbi:UrcA family protein [Sphingopyxis sp. PET50]|uniref:UrcA family protein n=1 Tax=Sphingopyxis sp. PET50 TaxID=2976533 RepID=UPI0021AFD2B6|nr:UrcA family protein [Sphingopyxis sp. PET50]
MAKLTLILLAAPIALTGLSMPAAAQEKKTVIVRYDDLNISSVSGRERLNTRVKMAIRDVCNTRLAQGLRAEQKARQCETIAMKDADVKLASLFNGGGTALADRGPVIVAAP